MTLFYLVAPALKGTSEYSILLGQKGNNYVREGGNRTHDQQGTLQSYSRHSVLTSRDIKRVILLIGLFGHSPLGNRKFSNQTRFMEASPVGRFTNPSANLPLFFLLKKLLKKVIRENFI